MLSSVIRLPRLLSPKRSSNALPTKGSNMHEHERKAFLFTNVVDGRGRKYKFPVVVGAYAGNREIYCVSMRTSAEEIQRTDRRLTRDASRCRSRGSRRRGATEASRATITVRSLNMYPSLRPGVVRSRWAGAGAQQVMNAVTGDVEPVLNVRRRTRKR